MPSRASPASDTSKDFYRREACFVHFIPNTRLHDDLLYLHNLAQFFMLRCNKTQAADLTARFCQHWISGFWLLAQTTKTSANQPRTPSSSTATNGNRFGDAHTAAIQALGKHSTLLVMDFCPRRSALDVKLTIIASRWAWQTETFTATVVTGPLGHPLGVQRAGPGPFWLSASRHAPCAVPALVLRGSALTQHGHAVFGQFTTFGIGAVRHGGSPGSQNRA